MAREVPLRALGHAAATPRDQDVFRESAVGILDFEIRKLDATLVEVLVQVRQLALYDGSAND